MLAAAAVALLGIIAVVALVHPWDRRELLLRARVRVEASPGCASTYVRVVEWLDPVPPSPSDDWYDPVQGTWRRGGSQYLNARDGDWLIEHEGPVELTFFRTSPHDSLWRGKELSDDAGHRSEAFSGEVLCQ